MDASLCLSDTLDSSCCCGIQMIANFLQYGSKDLCINSGIWDRISHSYIHSTNEFRVEWRKTKHRAIRFFAVNLNWLRKWKFFIEKIHFAIHRAFLSPIMSQIATIYSKECRGKLNKFFVIITGMRFFQLVIALILERDLFIVRNF